MAGLLERLLPVLVPSDPPAESLVGNSMGTLSLGDYRVQSSSRITMLECKISQSLVAQKVTHQDGKNLPLT